MFDGYPERAGLLERWDRRNQDIVDYQMYRARPNAAQRARRISVRARIALWVAVYGAVVGIEASHSVVLGAVLVSLWMVASAVFIVIGVRRSRAMRRDRVAWLRAREAGRSV